MKYKFSALVLWLLFADNFILGATLPGRIDKAFESLNHYNYFEARELFQKSIKNSPCIANYGLSIIYYRNDNPFHQLDSAYSRINKAIAAFDLSADHEVIKLHELNIDRDSLFKIQDAIAKQACSNAIVSNDTVVLNYFIEIYDLSSYATQAAHVRDSLAFQFARKENNSESYQQFIASYPGSYLSNEAKARYEKALYEESVFDGKETSYAKFVAAYPKSPHVNEAMKKIYELATANSNNPDSYHAFILNYPGNSLVDEAWQQIYDLYLVTYDEESILRFRNLYPDFPDLEKLDEDLRLSRITLLVFKEGELFGLLGIDGKVVVEPRYDFIGKFHDGIASVSLAGKMGYITKSGEELIPPFFDDAENFHNNLAVVGEMGNYGVINRNGTMVVPLIFSEIGDFSEGLATAFDGRYYGYINRSGTTIIPFLYQSASEFRKGKAICQENEYYGLINDSGSVLLPFQNESLEWLTDDLLLVTGNGKSGLINTDGYLVLPLQYDEIGTFSCSRALIIKDGKLGFSDPFGKIVIPLVFDAGKEAQVRSRFEDDLAVIRKQAKFGVIDTSGTLIIPATYDDLSLIGDSLVSFKKNSKWGIRAIYSKNVSCQPLFDQISSCNAGTCIAVLKKKFGLIDIKGKILIPFVYESMMRIHPGLFVVQKSGKYGVVDIFNQVVVPFSYDFYFEKESGYLEFSSPADKMWLDVAKRRIFRKI